MYPRIRNLREDKDMSQTELSKLIGMSQTGYSKYETGENDIPTGILIKLAALHDTSVDYLLGLTDEKRPYGPAKDSAGRPDRSNAGQKKGRCRTQ